MKFEDNLSQTYTMTELSMQFTCITFNNSLDTVKNKASCIVLHRETLLDVMQGSDEAMK